jgi:hypothetical protein
MGISSSLGSSALLPAGLGFRNKIINGDMRIAQRGTGTITGSASAQYPVDRWVVYNGTGTVTFAQSTIAPAGYTNSLNATVTATGSYGTSGYTEIGQMIEGFNCQDLAWGTASAKLITVSFWVRSSVTGDTSGTWLTDSGVGLRMWLQLGMGTNYDTTGNTWTAGSLGSTSGSIDFAANSGATFYVTGVQVEQNLQPTPFEQRLIGVELALCQRYYYRTVYNGTSNTLLNGTGNSYSASSQINLFMLHPVPMRSIVSTLESANIGASDLSTADSGTASVVTGFTGNSSIFGTRVRLSATTSWNGPAFPIVFSGGYFALGAEL